MFLDGDIMALLINETKVPTPSNPLAPPTRGQDEDSSSSSEEEEEDSSSEEEMERGGEGQFQLGAMVCGYVRRMGNFFAFSIFFQ